MSGSSELTGSGDLPVFYQIVDNPALSLQLTCRQLHDEVQDVITRCARRPEYTADVLFVNNVGLWATWLSVPVRTVCVDTIRANFRLSGPPRDLARGIYKRDMWDGGGGGANMMTLATGTPGASNTSNGAWGFYDLLNGLLEGNIGPWPKTSRRQCDEPYRKTLRVKRLVLNITSTACSSDVLSLSEIDKWASTSQLPATFLPPSCSGAHFSDLGFASNHKIAAITFARLVHFLLSILQSPIHRRVYGESLFHKVGVVEVQVDGERYGEEVDLSKSLIDFSWVGEEEDNGSPFRQELVAEMLDWQTRTAERRRLAGFKTVQLVMT